MEIRGLRAGAVAVLTALVCGCQAGPSVPRDATAWAAARAAGYARADRAIGEARLWKPRDDPEGSPAFRLAPLIVHEIDAGAGAIPTEAAAETPTVWVSRSTATLLDRTRAQWTYVWQYETGALRGLRMTLGEDGFPTLFEILGDGAGLRPLFVARALDEAAVAQFGDVLPGRSFAVERSVDAAPDVVVLDVVEPGPIPLGPFVYLAPGSRDAVGLHCRCSPSRMAAVSAGVDYRLVAREAFPASWPLDAPPLETLLRWPVAGW